MVNSIVVIVGVLIVSLALFVMWVCWRCLDPPTSADDVKTATDLEDPGPRPTATTATGSEDPRTMPAATTATGSEHHRTISAATTATGSEHHRTMPTATGSEDPGTRPTATGSEDPGTRPTANTATGSEDPGTRPTATTATSSEDPRTMPTATTATGSEEPRTRSTATTATGSEDPRTMPTATATNDRQTTGGGRPAPPTAQPRQTPTGTSSADRAKRHTNNDRQLKEPDHERKQTTTATGSADPGKPAANATCPADHVMREDTIERGLQEVANKQPVRFTAEQLTVFTNGYSTQLGRGGFGKVYKGILPNGLDVAVKVLDGGLHQKTWKQQFMAEIGSIGRTHHINLVRLYGFCSDGTTHALVYEFMEHGSLDTYLSRHGAGMTLAKVAEIATGVAKGLRYLHEDCDPYILHLDIKPGNVLLDGSLTPKVGDFGLARLVNLADTHVTVSTLGGTFGYAPPEVFLEGDCRLTKKWDVYSFGILLLNMLDPRERTLAGQPWFPNMVWTSYQEGKLMELLGRRGEDECRELVERMCTVAFWCVQKQPPARPSMSKVVRMLEVEGDVVDIDPPPYPFEYHFGPAPAPAAN